MSGAVNRQSAIVVFFIINLQLRGTCILLKSIVFEDADLTIDKSQMLKLSQEFRESDLL